MEPDPGGPQPVDIDVIWDEFVKSVKNTHLDSDEDEFFAGVAEGQMYLLSVFASACGKTEEYTKLCKELDNC